MIYMIMDQTKNGKSRQGLNTEHYNRDEFVTNNTGKDLRSR